MSRYDGILVDFLFRLPDTNERNQAFQLLQNFIKQYDWINKAEWFQCMFGVEYQEFLVITAEQYFMLTTVTNPAEMVLKRYHTGMLGFRYILKYIRAWIKYKVKRLLEHKK